MIKKLYNSNQLSFRTGFLVPWISNSSIPIGWILCQGQAVSRTVYSSLFDLIGIKFGAGDGVNTFNVPDLRGRTVLGKDNMGGVASNRVNIFDATVVGNSGGAENSNLGLSNLPSHNHGGNSGNDSVLHSHNAGSVGGVSVDHAHVAYPTVQGAVVANTGGSLGIIVNSYITTSGQSVGHIHGIPSSGGISANHQHTYSTNAGNGLGGSSPKHANMQPIIIMNYIIKS